MSEINEKSEVNEWSESPPALPSEKVSKKRKIKISGSVLWCSILTVAIIVLYLFYFLDKNEKESIVVPVGTPGTGEMLFVNLDTISEHYKLVKILTEDIESDINKQNTIFENREKAFEKKYNQFQKNYEAGILTDVQIQLTSTQLQEEYQTILQEKQRVLSGLEDRQTVALTQVADSIRKAASYINQQKYNASFIFIYQHGSQILYGDPTKDITQEVLKNLNKHYKK